MTGISLTYKPFDPNDDLFICHYEIKSYYIDPRRSSLFRGFF